MREEWETEISQQEFESLAQRLMPSTRMIEKRRYRLPLPDGRTAEIHVHEKHLAGFSYAEVNLIMLTMPPISNRRLGSDGKSRRTSGSLMGLWLGKTAWKLYGGFWENNHKLFCRNEGNLIFV